MVDIRLNEKRKQVKEMRNKMFFFYYKVIDRNKFRYYDTKLQICIKKFVRKYFDLRTDGLDGVFLSDRKKI